MKEQFLEKVKETLEIEGRELQFSDNFKEYDEWDSLNLLSMIAMIDEDYGVVIDSNAMSKVQTLDELFQLIESNK
jgi:acyl carrier protein